MMFLNPLKERNPFLYLACLTACSRNFFICRKVNDGRVRARVKSQAVQRQIILRVEDHPITVQVTQVSFVFIFIFSLLWESSNKFHKILSLHRSCVAFLFLIWLYFFFIRITKDYPKTSTKQNVTRLSRGIFLPGLSALWRFKLDMKSWLHLDSSQFRVNNLSEKRK